MPAVIPRLGTDPSAPFPPAEEALGEPDGLLAWGGDLSPRRMLNAYGQGVFPWYSDSDPLLWWCPSVRCVLKTDSMYVSRRLGRLVRQDRFRITADQAFEAVIDACANSRRSTWITLEMRRAYRALHRLGFAHSVEAWVDGELAGGLYGVALGRMFFGESMFSEHSNASKVALFWACRALRTWGYPLLDCQIENPHLTSLGAGSMPRSEFLGQLRSLVSIGGVQGPWSDPMAAVVAQFESRG